METYKQEIKEKSRKLIWEHAVSSLTYNRVANRVFTPDYMRNLWHYCYDDCLRPAFHEEIHYDCQYFLDWQSFSDITYGTKRPEELKVAFFCGPEPENDVQHLMELGVRIENMYAFEYDKGIFRIAVDSLQMTYPQLKIFRGNIESFTDTFSSTFDIIYLDFTGSLLTEFKTVCKMFENNALSEQCVLIVNTTYPDKTDENIDFLSRYFYVQECFERCALFGEEECDEDEKEYKFVETCLSYGLYTPDDVKKHISENFEEAYGAFQTHFVNSYAAMLKPIVSVLNNRMLKERVFDLSEKDLRERAQDYLNNSYIIFDPSLCSWGTFTNIVEVSRWKQFFNIPEMGMILNRGDAIRIKDMYMNSTYDNLREILSTPLQIEIDRIMDSLVDKGGGLFCDVPMQHLWLEMLINQLGYPYHQNSKNMKRYRYKAKERSMCLDILTFDRCRSLYDWLPMIEYYGAGLSVLERQMITRMCIDAINKHTIWVLHRQYYGSAMVGVYEKPWGKHYFPMVREEIK